MAELLDLDPDLIHEIAEMNSLLSSWVGTPVKIWDYSVGHRKMALRCESKAKGLALFIVGVGCFSISGPFLWENSILEVLSMSPQGVLLRDANNRFELRCDQIVLVEKELAVLGFPRW